MAGTTPYTELKNYLQATFNGVYAVLDFDEIDYAIEQGEVAFLALEEIVGTEDLIGIGDPSNLCTRETGTMIVHCFAPLPDDGGATRASDATRAIGDAVRDALRFKDINGVRISSVDPPDPGSLMNNGLWSSAALSFVYEWDQHYAAA